MDLQELGKETGGNKSGKWGGGGQSLRGCMGSDVYQSKHQRHNCVVPLTTLAYLWGLGLSFFLLPHSFPFFPFLFQLFFFCQQAPKAQGGLMPA